MKTRQLEDSLGIVEVPEDVYYGAATERARQCFAVSGRFLGDCPAYVSAIAEVKKAAAMANADVGILRPAVAAAICQAADEVVAGAFDRTHFPVDMLSAGGGVAVNMNINEVLATRANEIICGTKGYEFVHPNNHVNAGQSTSDALATALGITLHRQVLRLIESVQVLETVLAAKIDEYRDVVKLSRTCLQDAVPVTFSQEFSAYLAVARRGIERLAAVADTCLDVPMGGTVIGTGLGVGQGYVDRIYPRLCEVTGLSLRRHPNFFDAFQNGDLFQYLSSTFKALATNLAKMGKDLRLLASNAMAEITLPAVMAGSSFIPGKINPVMPEFVVQLAFQVCGNDLVVTMAVEGAELDFNAWTGVIAKNLFESCQLLTAGIPLFTEKCLRGLQVNIEHCQAGAEKTLSLSSVVGSVYGYDVAARVAHTAHDQGISIKDSAVGLRIMSESTAAALLDPLTLTDAERSSVILDRMIAKQREDVGRVVAGLSPQTRSCLLDIATAVAKVDGRVSTEEAHALEVVSDALQLESLVPANTEEYNQNLSILSASERELIYTCAAWLAGTDTVTEASEIELLRSLETQLGLNQANAEALRTKVSEMKAERLYHVPRCEQLPWWEDFATLITWCQLHRSAPI
jgi:aspartate ammonia-lyase